MADGPASTRDLVFISYSHADEPPWLDRLQIVLKPYVRQGKLQAWSDPYIRIGDTWRREITTALARTRIGVCLVSPNFLASDFIDAEELPPLLAAAASGEVIIVAIPVSSVDPSITRFAELQWGRDPQQPLDKLKRADRNAALVAIVKKIAEAAGTAQEKASRPQQTLTGGAAGDWLEIARQHAEAVAREEAACEGPTSVTAPPPPPPAPAPATGTSLQTRIETIAGGAVGSIATGAIAALSGGGISLIAGLAAVGGTIAALAIWQRIAFPRIRPGDEPAAQPEAEAMAAPAAAEPALAILYGVPEQKLHYVARDDDRLRVKVTLLANHGSSVGITASRPAASEMAIGLHGMGGIGKTELAIALAHDRQVRAAFPDGIFWLTLGQTPDLLPLQGELWRMAGGGAPAFADAGAGQRALLAMFREKAALIVLDDIWRIEDAAPLAVAGPHGRLLTTTRDASLLTALGAAEVALDVLSEGQALQLLANWSGQDRDALPAAAKAVARECGNLPLALALAGAQVKDKLTWTDVLAALQQGDLEFLDHPYGSVFKSLRASVEVLTEDEAARYGELTVALEDVPLPVAAVAKLWKQSSGLKPHTSRKLLQRFANKGLVSLTGEGDTAAVGFHDLQYDFLRLNADDPRAPHRMLLDAYRAEIGASAREFPGAWARLPSEDLYLWSRLADHLLAADLEDELRTLLLDYRWIAAKLAATGINSLIADYDRLPGDEDLNLVQQALHLSGHVLLQHPDQLPSQLAGRLRGVERPALSGLVRRIEREASRPWFSPQTHALTPPGGPLLRTLEGHANMVSAVAVLPDGRRALSGSRDKKLKLWDLATGALLRTLEGHAHSVTAVAVLPDGRRALSGAWDKNLKLWDLATGALLHTLAGHTGGVAAVAVLPNGRYALSGSGDTTLKLWDLATGAPLRTLKGHAGRVSAVAVLPDGNRALSGSDDTTLKLWDLTTGALLHTLKGHAGRVSAVAVLPDGRRALSGSSWDRTLKLWDLETGAWLCTIKGLTGRVSTVAVLPDGRCALSGSGDTTLKLWDLETGALLRTLEGHAAGVAAVAMLPDGRRALSGSGDTTLKLWDLEASAQHHTLKGHAGGVAAVVALPDGHRALSGSGDKTLKLWDLESGALLRALEGHANGVSAVAVLPDGRRALSGGTWGRTLKLWDLETGALLLTLKGHAGRITAVVTLPDGRRVLSGSGDNTLKLWDLQTGALLRTFEGHADWVTAVAPLPDGHRALSGSNDKALKLWDLESGAWLRTIKGLTGRVSTVAVLPDGRCALSGSGDKTLKLWDLETGALLRTLEDHAGEVTTVAVLPDGQRALSGSEDKTLKLWDLKTGACLASFTADAGIGCVAAASDYLFVAGDASGALHILRLID